MARQNAWTGRACWKRLVSEAHLGDEPCLLERLLALTASDVPGFCLKNRNDPIHLFRRLFHCWGKFRLETGGLLRLGVLGIDCNCLGKILESAQLKESNDRFFIGTISEQKFPFTIPKPNVSTQIQNVAKSTGLTSILRACGLLSKSHRQLSARYGGQRFLML